MYMLGECRLKERTTKGTENGKQKLRGRALLDTYGDLRKLVIYYLKQ